VALTEDKGEIEVWGDGEQTRSFMYVDDCLEGLIRIMASDHHDPLNLGTDELVTINELVDLVARIAGKQITKRHNLSGPQGVRGRNSDNTRLREVLGWEPSIRLEQGMGVTFEWIAAQVLSKVSCVRSRFRGGGLTKVGSSDLEGNSSAWRRGVKF
jgi:GDP-D-mannose 3',5'-epimerase